MKTATELKFGEIGIIDDLDQSNPSFRRLLEMGFTPGQEIQLISVSAFNDPIAFAVRGTLIAIRKTEADCIIIS